MKTYVHIGSLAMIGLQNRVFSVEYALKQREVVIDSTYVAGLRIKHPLHPRAKKKKYK
jgi:hypothetical protein